MTNVRISVLRLFLHIISVVRTYSYHLYLCCLLIIFHLNQIAEITVMTSLFRPGAIAVLLAASAVFSPTVLHSVHYGAAAFFCRRGVLHSVHYRMLFFPREVVVKRKRGYQLLTLPNHRPCQVPDGILPCRISGERLQCPLQFVSERNLRNGS